jgi:hypothetical protein
MQSQQFILDNLLNSYGKQLLYFLCACLVKIETWIMIETFPSPLHFTTVMIYATDLSMLFFLCLSNITLMIGHNG